MGTKASERTLYDAFSELAVAHAALPAVSTVEGTLHWGRLQERTERIAAWLIHSAAVAVGETIAIVSEESLMWMEVSMAIQATCAVEFPRETSIAPEELVALQKELGFRIAFFQNSALAERHATCSLEARIVMEGTAPENAPANLFALSVLREVTRSADTLIKERNAARDPGSTAAIIRTSGTTGNPKLVPISHHSLLHMMYTLSDRATLTSEDRILSILPPWHLYARLVQCAAIRAGCEVFYGSPGELAALPSSVHPTIFPGFPEIWEAVHHRIIARFTGFGFLGRPFFWSLALARRVRSALDCILGRERYLRPARRPRRLLRRATMALWLPALPFVWLMDLLIFRRIRMALGGRLRIAIVGDAPVPLAIDQTLRALGFSVLEGYGSTEQCVTVMRSPERNVPGTSGTPLPGTSVLILDENDFPLPPGRIGEIAVNGPQVFAGYTPPGSAQDADCFVAVREQLFYRTGDLGCLDFHGNLCFIGRRAHAFHLENGTRIFPELIEGVIRGHRFVDRIVVIGQGLAAPVALVVPNFEELYLEMEGAAARARRARTELPMRAIMRRALARNMLDGVFRFRPAADLPWDCVPPARVVLLSHAFRAPDEITLTMKPRRAVIHTHYADTARRALAQDAFVTSDMAREKRSS